MAKHTIVYSTIRFRIYKSYTVCLTGIWIPFLTYIKFFFYLHLNTGYARKHQVKATQAPHTQVLWEGIELCYIYLCIHIHFVRCNIIHEKGNNRYKILGTNVMAFNLVFLEKRHFTLCHINIHMTIILMKAGWVLYF